MDKDNIESCYFAEDAEMPNNRDLPAIIYRKVLGGKSAANAEDFKASFSEHGWQGIWQNGIYHYHHFHPDAHEVLGIAAGQVTVQLGGAKGKIFDLNHGDMVVLPAGTGHRNLSASDDLVVIGAYPKGQTDYTICQTKHDYAAVEQLIKNLPLPEQDPFFGRDGPLLRYWHSPGF